jgi:hypothetical protein
VASPPLPLVGTERDAAQLEPVAVMQPGTLGEYTAKPAGRGRMRVAVHPLVLGVVAPDHPMPWLEARQLHVLRVGAADGDDVCLERELPLDAGRFRATHRRVAVGRDDETGVSGPHRRTVLSGAEVR